MPVSDALHLETTPLEGLLLLTPRRFGDARGFFSESWNKATMQAVGIDLEFVQDNHSLSERKGTLRGLHFQTPPMAQAKLVRCGRGALFDVAVDIRRASPTFGQWFGVELSAENGRQLLVPVGFAHGFVTLQDDTEICYKCTAPYAPDCDAEIAWNDPVVGVDWGVSEPVLSDKDAQAGPLAKVGTPF